MYLAVLAVSTGASQLNSNCTISCSAQNVNIVKIGRLCYRSRIEVCI